MTFALDAATKNGEQNTATFNITTNSVSAGSMVVFCIKSDNTGTPSYTGLSCAGESPAMVGSVYVSGNANNTSIQYGWIQTCASGGVKTISVTNSQGAVFTEWFSGSWTPGGGAFDLQAGATGASNSITPAAAHELILAWATTASGATITPGTAITLTDNVNTSAASYVLDCAAGANAYTIGGSGAQASLLAAFKLPAGGAAKPKPSSFFRYLMQAGAFCAFAVASGSVFYGATADAGQTDDPVTDATAYAGGATYARGAIVTNSGSYFMSLADANVGNATSNTTWWFALTFFYYFDPAGSDANTGSATPATAKASPLKTLDGWFNLIKTGGAAIAGSMALFNRGGTYTGNCYTQKACVMGAYGSGARPVLTFNDHLGQGYLQVIDMHAQTIVRNLAVTGNNMVTYPFTPTAGTLIAGDVVTDGTFNATVVVAPGATGTLQVSHTAGQIFTPPATVTSGAKTGTVNTGGNGRTLVGSFGSGSADNQVVNCTLYNCFGNGFTLGNSTPNNSDRTQIINNIVHDTCLWGGAGSGIDGGWGTGIKIQHNTCYDNGRGVTFSHNIYVDDLDNADISYNKCYYTANYGSFGVVCHGVASNVNIHHNYILNSGNGISVADGNYGTTESFTGFNVYSNWIVNAGTWGNSGLVFQIGSNVNCNWYDNVAYGCLGEIDIVDKLHAGAVTNTSNLKFYQNTIDSSANINADSLFISGASITGLDIRNNIFYTSRSDLGIVQKGGVPNNQVAFAYNDCYAPNRASPFDWDSVAYSLASLQAQAFGGLSGTGNIGNNCISTNPTFTAVGSDYTLQGSSPAKGTGLAGLGITTDFAGNSFTNPPNMGAYA